ncbi:MAG: class I SAM-dependent methyltransferase [Hyphomonadaceae bacterium]
MASRSTSHGRTSFGADPQAYDAARPPYPSDLFDWLAGVCGLGPGAECVEIGAGTGLASLPVLQRGVRSLLAIEPDAGLAGRLRQKTDGDPRLDLRIARFEDVALAPHSADLVFAATSFHWLARGRALARVRAALRPGGWFAMWWHVFHDPETPDEIDRAVAARFEGLEEGRRKSGPQRAFGLDAPARLGELRSAGFTDVRSAVFEQVIDFSPDALAALFGTLSRVAGAPEPVRKALLEEVMQAVRASPSGRVRRTVRTGVYAGVCSPSASAAQGETPV